MVYKFTRVRSHANLLAVNTKSLKFAKSAFPRDPLAVIHVWALRVCQSVFSRILGLTPARRYRLDADNARYEIV